MAKKNEEEKINELALKIKQLEAQKKSLEARTKEKERKERTRRLIQIGAIIESLGISNLEIAEKFKYLFQNNSTAKEILEKFLIENNKITTK